MTKIGALEISQYNENKNEPIEIYTPNEFIELNIRGSKFKISKEKLKQYPESSKLNEILVSNITSELYFDRDPSVFNTILNYSPNAKLHINMNECLKHLVNEFNFWFNSSGLDEYLHLFDLCCKLKLVNFEIEYQNEIDYEKKTLEKYHKENKSINYGRILPGLRQKIWSFLDKPLSSCSALIYFIFSQIIILLFVLNIIVDTCESNSSINNTINSKNGTISYSNIYFIRFENILMAIFTAEFSITFIICPFKLKFFKKFLNIVDFLTILIYFVNLIVENFYPQSIFNLIKLTSQMFRIILLFKVTKLSIYLRALGITIQNSLKELIILFIYLFICILIFSTMIYYSELAEFHNNSQFGSIPAAFW